MKTPGGGGGKRCLQGGLCGGVSRKSPGNKTECCTTKDSLLWNGSGGRRSETISLAPMKAIKKEKKPDRMRGGNSNDIAHGSIN